MGAAMKYALRWSEAKQNGDIVVKQKEFETERARTKFADRLEAKPRFLAIQAWSDGWGSN